MGHYVPKRLIFGPLSIWACFDGSSAAARCEQFSTGPDDLPEPVYM